MRPIVGKFSLTRPPPSSITAELSIESGRPEIRRSKDPKDSRPGSVGCALPAWCFPGHHRPARPFPSRLRRSRGCPPTERAPRARAMPDSNLSGPFRPLKTTEGLRGRALPGEKQMKSFCVELKVCEGCGGLWIRAAGHGVYCRGCASWLAEFPIPRPGRRRGRKRKHTRALVCAGGGR